MPCFVDIHGRPVSSEQKQSSEWGWGLGSGEAGEGNVRRGRRENCGRDVKINEKKLNHNKKT